MAIGSDDLSRRAVEPAVPPGWPARRRTAGRRLGRRGDADRRAVGGVHRRPALALVEPVHQAGPGQGRPAARGRHAGVDVPGDQALLPVRDAGEGDDRGGRPQSTASRGRCAPRDCTPSTRTCSRTARSARSSARGRSPRAGCTAPRGGSGWRISGSCATRRSTVRPRCPVGDRGWSHQAQPSPPTRRSS